MRSRPASVGSSSTSGGAGERCEALLREGLAEDGAVLDQPSLLCGERVEAGRDQRVQRLRHLQRLDRSGRPVDVALASEQPAVEQHAHRLDRVERHALGALEDAPAQLVGQARHEAGEELVHRVGRERLEVERAEAALAGAPGRALVRELGPRQREHEERVAAGPVEQVLEEVEQAGVRPLHVLEDEHRRRLAPPAARRGSARRRRGSPGRPAAPSSSPSRWARRGSTHAPLVGVEDVFARARAAACPARSPVPRPRRCRSASSPSPPEPSRRRRRRRRGSGRDARRSRGESVDVFSNSQASRDLPIPAMPFTSTS